MLAVVGGVVLERKEDAPPPLIDETLELEECGWRCCCLLLLVVVVVVVGALLRNAGCTASSEKCRVLVVGLGLLTMLLSLLRRLLASLSRKERSAGCVSTGEP